MSVHLILILLATITFAASCFVSRERVLDFDLTFIGLAVMAIYFKLEEKPK